MQKPALDRNVPSERDSLRAAFQKIWGYEDFRPPQGEIAQALFQGKDLIVIMPTHIIFSGKPEAEAARGFYFVDMETTAIVSLWMCRR
ncbi:MAG: hypothetical protein AAF171_23535 [Cyanobacteria bacterium P01_A01_bin.116]